MDFMRKLMGKKPESNPDHTMCTSEVTVHPRSEAPTIFWKEAVKQKCQKLSQKDICDTSQPVPDGFLRFVCLSDTHNKVENLPLDFVPPGDVLLHAGDFSMIGLPVEIEKFNEYLGKLPHPLKIVIAGNHDLTFDEDLVKHDRKHLQSFGVSEAKFEDYLLERGVTDVKKMLTNCIYIEDEEIKVCGVKIYGSPWQPEFCSWGFNLPRGEILLDKWNKIPDDTDILMTHGPPAGHGDKTFSELRAGCVELLHTIQRRVHAKYHIYGHIHEGYGITTDGNTVYINASNLTLRYKPENAPIVFDFPIPEGHSKEELLDLVKPKVKEEAIS